MKTSAKLTALLSVGAISVTALGFTSNEDYIKKGIDNLESTIKSLDSALTQEEDYSEGLEGEIETIEKDTFSLMEKIGLSYDEETKTWVVDQDKNQNGNLIEKLNYVNQQVTNANTNQENLTKHINETIQELNSVQGKHYTIETPSVTNNYPQQ